jgi:hypothetical protein
VLGSKKSITKSVLGLKKTVTKSVLGLSKKRVAKSVLGLGKKPIALRAAKVAVVGVGGALLYYGMSAASSKKRNAALIPDAIETHLDTVVEKLNERFGHGWVKLGVATLSAALPTPLVMLIGAVQKAEEMGLHEKLTGKQKKEHAVNFAQASA